TKINNRKILNATAASPARESSAIALCLRKRTMALRWRPRSAVDGFESEGQTVYQICRHHRDEEVREVIGDHCQARSTPIAAADMTSKNCERPSDRNVLLTSGVRLVKC